MRNKTCVDMENRETRSCLGSNGFPWRYDSICDAMDWCSRENFNRKTP